LTFNENTQLYKIYKECSRDKLWIINICDYKGKIIAQETILEIEEYMFKGRVGNTLKEYLNYKIKDRFNSALCFISVLNGKNCDYI
jgi:hypothetical protein